MKWYMLTLVGQDRPGIVAKVTSALNQGGCNLGEASMMRLGGNFAMMMMVEHEGTAKTLEATVASEAESLSLRMHVDAIKGELHHHIVPDVRITVSGADRAGIVAAVTSALAEAGLNITDLESDVAGTEEKPIYIMYIEGQALEGMDSLRSALEVVGQQGIEATIRPIDTVVG
jgi:glycine cleavage system transcriptional repressor